MYLLEWIWVSSDSLNTVQKACRRLQCSLVHATRTPHCLWKITYSFYCHPHFLISGFYIGVFSTKIKPSYSLEVSMALPGQSSFCLHAQRSVLGSFLLHRGMVCGAAVARWLFNLWMKPPSLPELLCQVWKMFDLRTKVMMGLASGMLITAIMLISVVFCLYMKIAKALK